MTIVSKVPISPIWEKICKEEPDMADKVMRAILAGQTTVSVTLKDGVSYRISSTRPVFRKGT